jgi:hypothetical protein
MLKNSSERQPSYTGTKMKNKKETSSKESIKAHSNTMKRNHKIGPALSIGTPNAKIIIKLPKSTSAAINLVKQIKSTKI